MRAVSLAGVSMSGVSTGATNVVLRPMVKRLLVLGVERSIVLDINFTRPPQFALMREMGLLDVGYFRVSA